MAARENDGKPPAFQASAEANVVTIPGHPGDDLPKGTLKSVLKAAGLEEKA